jgi:uncharacterized protein YbjT (DUF2867 family)
MKIAIATPTGHIGSKVTENLLAAGAELILLARDPSKVEPFARRGAVVRQGWLEDPDFVADATRGADELFWLTPPHFTTEDLRGFQRNVARAAARAIAANSIARVVNISSIGAQLESGAGPISGLHDVEKLLDDAAWSITHFRCGFFFENYLWQVERMQRESSIYMPISGSVSLPMVATGDIARAVANRLLDSRWSGRSIRGIHGPVDLTFDEAARLISEGVGRPIRHVKVPEDAARKAMQAMGASRHVADQMLEMYQAIDTGLVKPAEPRSPETTTPTDLLDFARNFIAPLVAAEVPVGV